MSGIYAGSSPKFLTRIRDENGVQLDPEDINQIIEVKIWIYNAISGTVVAKFYLNTAPTPLGTWRQAEVKTIGPSDKRILLTLLPAETLAAPVNKNEIQVTVTVPDADFDSGEREIIKKGRFADINPAKSS